MTWKGSWLREDGSSVNINENLRPSCSRNAEIPISHWTGRSVLVFRRYSVLVSVGTAAILTAVFRGFPQSFQANARILPRLGYYPFLPNPFKFIIHLSTYWPPLYILDIAHPHTHARAHMALQIRLFVRFMPLCFRVLCITFLGFITKSKSHCDWRSVNQ
jgi:hypothetical protein